MYPTKKLSEICIIGPKKSEVSKLDSDTLVSFVPMRDVKEGEMFFTPSESKKIEEVYSGYTYFNDEDVLLAKVTPCFENGKSGIARNLESGIGFGSSEFYVFRCNSEVLPEYLYRVISSQKFLKEGAENMSGAVGLKRVTKEFIENYNIPLPPLSTQSRIIARLDSAFASIDEHMSLLRANISDVENMKKSVLRDVFKDAGFEMKRIDSVALIMSAGGTPSRTESEFWGGNIPWYSSGELNDLYTKDSKEFITKKGLDNSSAKLFPQGTLLIGMYDTAAMKMSILDREGSCNQAVVGFFPKKEIIDVFYTKYYLTEIKEKVLEGRQGVRQKNLNLSKLKDILIPLPPLPRQHEIVAHLDGVFAETEALRGEYEAQIRDLGTLKQSLLEEAFTGRLVSEEE